MGAAEMVHKSAVCGNARGLCLMVSTFSLPPVSKVEANGPFPGLIKLYACNTERARGQGLESRLDLGLQGHRGLDFPGDAGIMTRSSVVRCAERFQFRPLSLSLGAR